MIAASAMKPRPLVIPSVNVPTSCNDSTAPPRPASAPPATIAAMRTRTGLLPAVKAASGFSPTARSISPMRVFARSTEIASVSANAA